MAQYKRKPKKRKAKVKLSTQARLRKKSDRVDTLPNAPMKVPSNGVVFKVKVKKK